VADIPIKHAMIAWNSKRHGDGRIVVVLHPDRTRMCDKLSLSSTTGACNSGWERMTKEQRLLNLFMEAWWIVLNNGLDPKDVHAAFMVIPEYRELLIEAGWNRDFPELQVPNEAGFAI
jgi:hypothetical protein